MSTPNSPGASGRFGAAFICEAMETSDLFGGQPIDNSLQHYFSKKVSHPEFGEGRVLFGADGLPAVLLWLHVDGILIHPPTLAKLETALDHIL